MSLWVCQVMMAYWCDISVITCSEDTASHERSPNVTTMTCVSSFEIDVTVTAPISARCWRWDHLANNQIMDKIAPTAAPCKHETLNQCWADVGPTSATLAQHQPSIGSMSRACWGIYQILCYSLAVNLPELSGRRCSAQKWKSTRTNMKYFLYYKKSRNISCVRWIFCLVRYININ